MFRIILSAPFLCWAICLVGESLRRRRYASQRRRQACEAVNAATQSSFLFGIDWLFKFSQSAKQNRVLQYHNAEHIKYGNTFVVHVLGSSVLHTCEPEYLKAILGTQFEIFDLGSARHRAFSPFLGNGIFTVSGPAWSKARHLLRGNFSRAHIEAILPSLESKLATLLESVPSGKPVDLQPLFLKLTMDVATESLFGYSTANQAPSGAFSENFEIAQEGMALRARLGVLNAFYTDPKFSNACVAIHDFVDNLVQTALTHRSMPQPSSQSRNRNDYVFLYALVDQIGEDPKLLRDHVLNILVAGRDTTAGLISIACFLLSRNERVWRMLQNEVSRFNGKCLNFDELKSLKYLSHVLKEVLRLYSITPLIGRQVNQDTVLPGPKSLFVQKGQRVALSIHAMHRRKDIFGEDADLFKPERWETLRPGWGYLPFSGGSRVCIGQQFALIEASYIIVRLLQNYKKITPSDLEPFSETVGLTLASKNGCKVILTQ
ncbi:cytochrome P450 [Tothia fuscella]|uniref:Cytochrome P450 n=1 Tax=Tothia fuscella TaxID=1048955 RepID=A0A9P4NFW6_9PEZI|nr:cytochrome P450 [Tothia fuscella]